MIQKNFCENIRRKSICHNYERQSIGWKNKAVELYKVMRDKLKIDLCTYQGILTAEQFKRTAVFRYINPTANI